MPVTLNVDIVVMESIIAIMMNGRTNSFQRKKLSGYWNTLNYFGNQIGIHHILNKPLSVFMVVNHC